MAVTAVCFCTYLTGILVPWRHEDHNAHKFIKALKGDPINGYARILVGRTWHRLQESNRDSAIDWFGEMAADYVTKNHKKRPLALAPVPSSNCVVGGRIVSPIYRMADAIASRLQNVTVWDGLRWSEAMIPSHKGGIRNAAHSYAHLRITRKLPEAEIVIVDDVLTSGSHIRAIAAKLTASRGVCKLAVCAGRTVGEQVEDPFAIIEEELADFKP